MAGIGMMRLVISIALTLSGNQVLAFGGIIRSSTSVPVLCSRATPVPLASLRALSPSPSDDDRLAVWRHAHVAMHRAVQRSVVVVRSVAQKVALTLLTLMVCMPFSPSYSLALPAIEPPAIEAQASSRPRYYEQALSTPLVTETAMPAVALRLPGLDGTLIGRRKTSFVTAAVQAVGPAVVRIDTERLVDRPALEGYLVPGSPDGQRKESGQGSGVILSEDGARLHPAHPVPLPRQPAPALPRARQPSVASPITGLIMTNAHVVKNAARVTVTLIDGRTFEGVVKGSDDFMDLAAIRITPSGKPLPTAPLGRSGELQVRLQRGASRAAARLLACVDRIFFLLSAPGDAPPCQLRDAFGHNLRPTHPVAQTQQSAFCGPVHRCGHHLRFSGGRLGHCDRQCGGTRLDGHARHHLESLPIGG